MKGNNLIEYKENIFTKISRFFKKIFFIKEKTSAESNYQENVYNKKNKEKLIENIVVKESEEEKRLKKLQKQYDNNEIREEDISDKDIDLLIEMYERETKKLNMATEIRRINISKMLRA